MLGFDAVLQAGESTKHGYASLDLDGHLRKRLGQKYRHGWRFGAIICAILSTLVFITNLIITIVCSVYGGQRNQTLYVGDCEKTQKINTGLHVLINLLSTTLLSASNYCMQCMSAPTRDDIDVARARGKWLDIGVLSIRNLRCISRKRVILWTLLGLSSLPLHLFYNSVVYVSITGQEYTVAAVGESFIANPNCDNCSDILGSTHAYNYIYDMDHRDRGPAYLEKIQYLHEQAHEGHLEKLSNLDCINAYAQMIQLDRGSLFLVVRDEDVPAPNEKQPWMTVNHTSPVFWRTDANPSSKDSPTNKLANAADPYSWICSQSSAGSGHFRNCVNEIQDVRNNPSNWSVYTGSPIQYCLSEKIEGDCQIRWSTQIAIIVVMVNFLIGAIIFYTVFTVEEEPLMASGDAIASFLQRPDMSTANMCLASKNDIVKAGHNFNAGRRQWAGRRYSWRHSVSLLRRVLLFLLMAITIAAISGLFGFAVYGLELYNANEASSFTNMDFGALDPRAIVRDGPGGVLANTFIANAPQVLISLIYFSYNSYFATMLLGYEWATYAYKRKGLRVTTEAKGAQRSSYSLSLPYKFGLPLIAVGGLMHWLVSQSIFFVEIQTRSMYDNNTIIDTIQTVGYSPVAMIVGIVVGVVLMIIAIGTGYIPHRPGINIVGSCSAAISAACHPSSSSEGSSKGELAYKKLQWGVVSESADGVGHCSFSDGPVELPQKGKLYAGS